MKESTDFPTMNPIHTKHARQADMFLAKLNATGSALVYSTYLGGSDSDGRPMIALDARGNLYFEAWTSSTDIPTANAFQTESAGSVDIWVGKVNAAGDALAYSTYLGGSDSEVCGSDIVVDPAGNNYLNGFTCSTDFPTLNPIQPENAGGCDAFLTKLNPAGNALVYSTYLGGSSWEEPSGIALGPSGDAYIQGTTASTDFPVVNALQPTNAGGLDTFVARIRPTTASPSTSLFPLSRAARDEG